MAEDPISTDISQLLEELITTLKDMPKAMVKELSKYDEAKAAEVRRRAELEAGRFPFQPITVPASPFNPTNPTNPAIGQDEWFITTTGGTGNQQFPIIPNASIPTGGGVSILTVQVSNAKSSILAGIAGNIGNGCGSVGGSVLDDSLTVCSRNYLINPVAWI